jgi:hypothetical protein
MFKLGYGSYDSAISLLSFSLHFPILFCNLPNTKSTSLEFMKISRYTKRAIWGGVFSLLLILGGTFLLGNLSGHEAKVLIKNSLAGGHQRIVQYDCFGFGNYFSLAVNLFGS